MDGARVMWGGKLRRLGAIALLCLVSACASAPSQYAAVDPRKDNGDGLGGTGISTASINPRGDGLGGTGIIGTISAFGSIVVNGLKLEFDHTTAVESDGKPASLEELSVGQVIQGVAHTRDGRLHLDTLEIQHAVAGPISAIDYSAETMTILGQKVRLNLGGDRAAVDAFKTLRQGDVVNVSGLRLADGTVVATRVDQRRDDGRIVLRGNVGSVTSTSMRVGELDIALGGTTVLSAPQTGGRVFASGRMINGKFVADVINGLPTQPFNADVKEVSLEGYVPPGATSGAALSINGVTVSGATLPAGASANDRVVITGRVDAAGHITATGISKVQTVVSVLRARGSMRPMWVRPESNRPERVRPPERPDRPQSVRPDRPERPPIERPSATS